LSKGWEPQLYSIVIKSVFENQPAPPPFVHLCLILT
jgi:hypothetical protein